MSSEKEFDLELWLRELYLSKFKEAGMRQNSSALVPMIEDGKEVFAKGQEQTAKRILEELSNMTSSSELHGMILHWPDVKEVIAKVLEESK